LQDKYHKRLTDKGFDLERGIKNSDNDHLNIKEYKKITKKLNLELDTKNQKLNNAMEELSEKMLSNKEVMFDKEYIKIKKDTFDSMNKVIDESKQVMEMQPKMKKLHDEVDNYAISYKALQRENQNIKKEVTVLRYKNHELQKENNSLLDYIKTLLEVIKDYLRDMLKLGNESVKDRTVTEIIDYYEAKDFDEEDVEYVAEDTSREEEIYERAEIDMYYQKDKSDDFDIGM